MAINMPKNVHMKTTVEIPDEVLHRAKVVAAQRRITLKDLITEGLNEVMRPRSDAADREAALRRLRTGVWLGAIPLKRAAAHERSKAS
jgi:hypothetical protein